MAKPIQYCKVKKKIKKIKFRDKFFFQKKKFKRKECQGHNSTFHQSQFMISVHSDFRTLLWDLKKH